MLIYSYGEGQVPSYAIEVRDLDVHLPDGASSLRGAGAKDAASRLEDAGQAVADACEHLLARIHGSLTEDLRPNELELKFAISLAGEGGLPIIGKASAEASFEVRAKWLGPAS